MLHSFIYGFGKVKFCVDGAVNLLFNFTRICVEMVGDSLKVNQILRSRCSGSDGDIYSVMTNTQTEVTDGGYTAEGLRHVSEHHVGASWVRVDTVYSGFCLVLTWLHITRLTMNKSSVQVFIGNMLKLGRRPGKQTLWYVQNHISESDRGAVIFPICSISLWEVKLSSTQCPPFFGFSIG